MADPAAFTIDIPHADDAPVISDIHLRAMDSNLLTHAQFPSPRALSYFRDWLTRNTVQHIHDADKGVLTARDAATGEIASFIKWLEHGVGGEAEPSTPPCTGTTARDEWPQFCGRDVLAEYADIAAAARKRLPGKKGYFHVTFVCTHPKWGGRGAASALLQDLKDMAAAAGKAIVLEAVMPAVPLYQRLGFEIRQQLQLMLPSPGTTDRSEPYTAATITPPSQLGHLASVSFNVSKRSPV
ncbi:hypothetical protein E4U53_001698 [Claviceps sorghi]|nr:hypothetical protein E4U53_001698 [Claviceps sorghi]